MQAGEEHERADSEAQREGSAADRGHYRERRDGVEDPREIARVPADEAVDAAAGRVERRRRDEGRPQRDLQAGNEDVRPGDGGETEDDRETARLVPVADPVSQSPVVLVHRVALGVCAA